jgi:hypothetical protein
VETADAVYFPLVITGVGILVSFITIWFAHMEFFGENYTVDKRLFWQVIISTVIMTAAIIPCIFMLPDQMVFNFGSAAYNATPWKIFGCIAMGLWSGMIIGAPLSTTPAMPTAPPRPLPRALDSDPPLSLSRVLLSDIFPILSQSSASPQPSSFHSHSLPCSV